MNLCLLGVRVSVWECMCVCVYLGLGVCVFCKVY